MLSNPDILCWGQLWRDRDLLEQVPFVHVEEEPAGTGLGETGPHFRDLWHLQWVERGLLFLLFLLAASSPPRSGVLQQRL